MFKKVLLGLVLALVVFAAFVATRPDTFRYERSGVINAPAAKIYPYLSQFKLGAQWSPYEQMDPNMKKTISANDGAVGATEEFESDKAGSGKLEILKLVPNELVHIRLTMTKPVPADNLVEYKLTPEGAGTRFTWSMSGKSGFLGKLIAVIIDCEKMMGGDFEKGIANVKALVEAQK